MENFLSSKINQRNHHLNIVFIQELFSESLEVYVL